MEADIKFAWISRSALHRRMTALSPIFPDVAPTLNCCEEFKVDIAGGQDSTKKILKSHSSLRGSFRKAGASAIPGLLVSLLRATPCYPKSNLQIEHSWKSWPFLRPVILPP
ncbi:hypothetical protein [Roseovarius rhodophyticola]|uniref:Uncharacterized protein n=1 Tax=Roseovarius rhodophyticola TaxID=3080827 RepID=A0ABZ2TG60_9RHOB|nr:hypothetical protein [Roseovarius sp. W115]